GAELAARLRGELGAPIEFARPVARCGALVGGYAEPTRLGVDRWLGMLAAQAQWPGAALAVVSAGTALTIDVVGAEGEHGGGYIIPGARLMAETLLRSTDRVRFADAPPLSATAPGRNTADCVHHGIALALVGGVRQALQQCRGAGAPPVLGVAGGDGAALAALLGEENPQLRADLVLDGLRLALP